MSRWNVLAAVAVLSATPAYALQDFTIGMRAAILSTDAAVAQLAERVFQAHGINYDVIALTTETSIASGALNRTLTKPASLGLFEADGTPKYNSLVFTNHRLGYGYWSDNGATLNWMESALTDAEWQQLGKYRTDYGVRSVMLSSSHTADIALQPALAGGAGTDSAATVTFNTTSPVVAVVRNSIPANAAINIGKEHAFLGNVYWTVPATVIPNRNGDNHIEPFMLINFADSALPKDTLGAFIRRATTDRQYEEMHFLFNTNPYGLHGFALANVWLPWVTRGLYIGQRRLVLSAQIDDWFLDTTPYNIQLNRQAWDNETTASYRITQQDVQALAAFQASYRTNTLPAGSNFTIEIAYNAQGYYEFATGNNGQPGTNMNAYIMSPANRDQFLWVTHTYSHMDLYCVESNCTTPATMPSMTALQACVLQGYTPGNPLCKFTGNTMDNSPVYPDSGFSPKAYIDYELQRNRWFANNMLFKYKTDTTLMNATERNNWKTWSRRSIVTPRISGLNYTEAIEGMLQLGLRYAVGDNSRADLKPQNPYWPFLATAKVGPSGGAVPATFGADMLAKYGQSSIMVIPRWATRIYFDVGLPAENEKEHNSFYGPNCIGAGQTGSITDGGLKCNTTTFKYPRDLTIDEIMAIEGFESARSVLAYLPQPFMFHQLNVRSFTNNGATRSLLSMWLDAVGGWLGRYSTLPVWTLKQDDLATYFTQRMARDTCGLQGKMTVQGGMVKSITVRSSRTCVAKVTQTSTEGAFSMASASSIEVYGVDKTASVSVTATTPVTITTAAAPALPNVIGGLAVAPKVCALSGTTTMDTCMYTYVDNLDAGLQYDTRRVGIAYDAANTFLQYELYAPESATAPLDLSWLLSAYINTDQNAANGYNVPNGVLGADFLIQGATVFKYSGVSPNWGWTSIGAVAQAIATLATLPTGEKVYKVDVMIPFALVPVTQGAQWQFTVVSNEIDVAPDIWVPGYGSGFFTTKFDLTLVPPVTTSTATSSLASDASAGLSSSSSTASTDTTVTSTMSSDAAVSTSSSVEGVEETAPAVV